MYDLYWQKGSEKIHLLESSDIRAIVSDGTYLITHTDRYQEKRQGKTECYRILYDDQAEKVTGIERIDVFYELRD